MFYYHATSPDKALQIVDDGEIKPGIDHIIYLADSVENAVKFVAIRGINPIIVFEIEVPDEALVHETFDHSYTFFECKSYGYPESIDTMCVNDAIEFRLPNFNTNK